MRRTSAGFDEHGNPLGRAFDLGGIDDERLRGEKILMYVAFRPRGEKFEWHHAREAVAERALDMDIVLGPEDGRCTLSSKLLASYSQLWFISDRERTMTKEQVQLVVDYVRAGNGLLIWADNEPYYEDANLLAKALIGTRFSGNLMGDGVLQPGSHLAPGYFIPHALTQGINTLYEGITISTIAPASDLTILAQSHDGQMCMACFEQGNKRIVLDTGFTKLHEGKFRRTAGTARYFRNIAFWLARGSRGIEYVQFTPGRERIAMISNGATSEQYAHRITEPTNLTYLLHWEGDATLGLIVQDPSGRVVEDIQSPKPPVRVTIAASAQGEWLCSVKGVRVPSSQVPYVLTLATSQGSVGNGSPVRKPFQARPGGPAVAVYSRSWSSVQPGCLIVLLDQSSSMDQRFGGNQVGAGKKKSEMVATILNALLHEFVRVNTVGQIIKPRAEVAVLGYEGGRAHPLLGGDPDATAFVALPELMNSTLRLDTRMRREVDEDGQVVEIPVHFPIWVDPHVGTATPMCAALERARDLAERWAVAHPDSYPPVVINITDGASTDGDPTEVVRELQQVWTRDGYALLFNCHITHLPLPSAQFPDQMDQVPVDPEQLAPLLFALSSEIPESARFNLQEMIGRPFPRGARGFIFNGDAASVRLMFNFATLRALR